jgi:hypothetical protein
MSDSANPVQQSVPVIEIRPFKGGRQCYEGPGVGPYWVGDNAKESAIDYAKARAKYGHSEIRVLRRRISGDRHRNITSRRPSM